MEWAENFKGLQHIGIPTNDMDKTVEFYKKIGIEGAQETKGWRCESCIFEVQGSDFGNI